LLDADRCVLRSKTLNSRSYFDGRAERELAWSVFGCETAC